MYQRPLPAVAPRFLRRACDAHRNDQLSDNCLLKKTGKLADVNSQRAHNHERLFCADGRPA